MTKPRAYLVQARADFDAYLAAYDVGEAGVGEHHRLQFLQMALEKVCKSFLYEAAPTAQFPHNVVTRGLNAMKRHDVAEQVGLPLRNLVRQLDGLKSVYLMIAAASPSIGFDGSEGRTLTREESERTQNVEYPWQDDLDDPSSWIAPAEHDFRIVYVLRRQRDGALAVRLLGKVVAIADRVLS